MTVWRLPLGFAALIIGLAGALATAFGPNERAAPGPQDGAMLRSPAAVSAATMPDLDLTDSEIEALVAYLLAG